MLQSLWVVGPLIWIDLRLDWKQLLGREEEEAYPTMQRGRLLLHLLLLLLQRLTWLLSNLSLLLTLRLERESSSLEEQELEQQSC
jgi:hypothetical protein